MPDSIFKLAKDVGLAAFFKVRDKARIDNLVFQAHYRFTTSAFFLASLLITAFTLFDKPIKCWNSGDDKAIKAEFLDPYCWATHTYTWINKDKRYELYPGVGPAKDGSPRYHTYYQWVPFMLFFHGLCFYLPHWIWKTWEGGKIKMMSEDIRGLPLEDSAKRNEKREKVVTFLLATRNSHKSFAYAYFGCEILNLINTVVTMHVIDKFLGNVFMDYGLKVFEFTQQEQEQRFDALVTIFPRITKCLFKSYGASGSPQEFDALCVLSLNNLNEKIYIFLWFWLIILGGITFCAVAYSAAFLCLPDVRRLVICKRFKFGTKYEVNELIRQISVGDFLLLHLLGQNLSTLTFHQLLEDMNNRLLHPPKCKKTHSYENGFENKFYNEIEPTYQSISNLLENHGGKDAMRLDTVDSRKLKIRSKLNEKSISAV